MSRSRRALKFVACQRAVNSKSTHSFVHPHILLSVGTSNLNVFQCFPLQHCRQELHNRRQQGPLVLSRHSLLCTCGRGQPHARSLSARLASGREVKNHPSLVPLIFSFSFSAQFHIYLLKRLAQAHSLDICISIEHGAVRKCLHGEAIGVRHRQSSISLSLCARHSHEG